MNPDVFLSLLALDAYNRGYDSNVGNLPEKGSIGLAGIREFQPREQLGWQAAGFYAIAYNWNGERVISYRGTNLETDFSTPLAIFSSPAFKDIWNSWGLGGGFTGGSKPRGVIGTGAISSRASAEVNVAHSPVSAPKIWLVSVVCN